MSWFKRKEQQTLIPPVNDAPAYRSSNSASPVPSYRSSANKYNASRDGDPYNQPSNQSSPAVLTKARSTSKNYEEKLAAAAPLSGFSRNDALSDPYSRGERNLDADRNALFSGYDPEKSRGSNRFQDGIPGRKTPPPGEEEDDDVEGIKQQTRFLKQETVGSSRNALRVAREAEETARNTLLRLGDQSEKIANTERHLDVAKGHTNRAEDNAIEIKKLNRSIFIPAITLNKENKRRQQDQKRQLRHEEEREEREKAMMDIRDTQSRLGRAATYGRDEDDGEGIAAYGRAKTASESNLRSDQRKKYQFEATGSDDELEDELDGNLDEISDMTKRLKALGTAMGQELDQQNERLIRVNDKTTRLTYKVDTNTDRLKRLH